MSALALHIRRMLRQRFHARRLHWASADTPDDLVYHRFISAGEHAVTLLLELGLVTPAPQPECSVAVIVAAPERFRNLNPDEALRKRLVSVFMMLAGQGGELWETGIWEFFAIPDHLQDAFEEIKPLGILEEFDQGWAWNEDAGPILHGRYKARV